MSNEGPRNSLKQDFRIFTEPGFLITVALLVLLFTAGAGVLVWATNNHGVPVWPYWPWLWS